MNIRLLKTAAMLVAALYFTPTTAQVVADADDVTSKKLPQRYNVPEQAFAEFIVECNARGESSPKGCPTCNRTLTIENYLEDKIPLRAVCATNVSQIFVETGGLAFRDWSAIKDGEELIYSIRNEDGLFVEQPKLVNTNRPLVVKLYKGWLISFVLAKKD